MIKIFRHYNQCCDNGRQERFEEAIKHILPHTIIAITQNEKEYTVFYREVPDKYKDIIT